MKNIKYWSNVGIKPNKFKIIDGKKRIYSCEIAIYYTEENINIYTGVKNTKLLERIEIKFKQKNRLELDTEWNVNYYKENIGGYIKYNKSLFTRDQGGFYYVKEIEVNKKLYLEEKQRIDRERKLKRLLK